MTGSPVPLAPRVAARAAARRWAGAWRVLLVVLVLGVLAGAAWVVYATALLGVRQVTVEGLHTLTRAQVTALVGVPAGTPLARVDPGAIERRVRTLPQVADASVTRQLPGTLRVRIRERTPVALLRDPAGHLRLVDRDGLAYLRVAPAAVASGAPARLPRIVAPVTVTPETVHGAVAALGALPPALRAQVRVVLAPGPNNLQFVLSGGRRVVWGGSADAARKAAVLTALIRQPGPVYDISAPDAPTTRKKP